MLDAPFPAFLPINSLEFAVVRLEAAPSPKALTYVRSEAFSPASRPRSVE